MTIQNIIYLNMTRANIIILTFSAFMLSCKIHKEPVSDKFLSVLNEKYNYSNSLKFNGFYTRQHKDSSSFYFAEEPIYFFNNNTLYFDRGSLIRDSNYVSLSFLQRELLVREPNKYKWGTYQIINDTIKAQIYCEYYKNHAHSIQFLISYYQGILVDKNIITNWHIVEPYPKINKELDSKKLEYQKEGRNFIFKENNSKALIDSNKAWILYKD